MEIKLQLSEQKSWINKKLMFFIISEKGGIFFPPFVYAIYNELILLFWCCFLEIFQKLSSSHLLNNKHLFTEKLQKLFSPTE